MSTPTTLYRAGTVHTMDDEYDGDTIAVVGGQIVDVGWWGELRARHPDPAVVVDLGDATVVPGLIDAHLHVLGGIEMTRGADLRNCATIDDIARAVAEHAIEVDDWVLGWGLDPNAFGGPPSGAVLDRAAPGRPVYIQLFDAHSAVASPAALRRAEIDGAQHFQAGSSIVVDDAGAATGLLLEREAMGLVQALIPPLSSEERKAALYEILLELARTGFTAGHALDMDGDDAIDILEGVATSHGLPLDLTISPILSPADLEAGIERVTALQGRGGQRWRVSGVKLFIDGTVDNGTAWLYEPDAHGESTRSLWMRPAEYAVAVGRLHDAGIPTRTHAIGDRGIEFVVDTLSALPPGGVSHRIEHIETVTDAVLDAMAVGGMSASMQPTHCTHFVRADGSDNWSTRLGPARSARGWRTRDIRDRGITLALGSDWPVAQSDARAILGDAQLRRPVGQPGSAPVGPGQGLSAREALEGFTTHAAASIGAEARAIRPGASASLTAFARDPLTTHPDVFATTSVVLTVIDGEHVIDNR